MDANINEVENVRNPKDCEVFSGADVRPQRRSWAVVFPVEGYGISVVRVVFSDESSVEYNNKQVFVVAGVMLNMDSQWHKLVKHFNMLPEGWRERREIKGARLLQDIRKERGPDSDRALRVMCQIPFNVGCPIFSGAVDPLSVGDLKPLDVAFRMCMDAVDAYLETIAAREKILWIADTCAEVARMKLIQGIQRTLTASTAQAVLGLGGQSFDSHLVDTVYFGDSHESRALQLADVCCSVISGHLLGDPVVKPYYEILRPRIVNEPRVLGTRNG